MPTRLNKLGSLSLTVFCRLLYLGDLYRRQRKQRQWHHRLWFLQSHRFFWLGWDAALLYRGKMLNAALTAWSVNNATRRSETGLAKKSGWQAVVNYDLGLAKLYGTYVAGKILEVTTRALQKRYRKQMAGALAPAFPTANIPLP